MLGAAACMLAAGEEISWGQCLFGWTTPDFLMGLNQQGETNIHNIYSRAFGMLHTQSVTLLCAVAVIALCYRQYRLFGIPLPSMPLLLGFLLLRLYEQSFYEGSVRISQAHVLHWVLTCIGHGERNNGSSTVSGLVFENR